MRTRRSKGAVLLLLFILSYQDYICQNYFSKRINITNKINQSGSILLLNDTLYLTGLVNEVPFTQVSTTLLKVDKFGNLITAKRFKPINRSYFGGGGGFVRHNKIYTTGQTDWGFQIQQGLYTFNTNSDTVFTRSYGDTVFYNYAARALPFLKTSDKLLIIGITDSSCGINHPGVGKPIIRVVDTNGVLHQTKLYNSVCYNNSLYSADTTIERGYVFCGYNSIGGKGRNYITKLDSNLNQQWSKNIDTTSSVSNAVISLKKGHLLYATTRSIYNGTNLLGDKIALTRFDKNGNVIWSKQYGNAEDTYVERVKECTNGDFILCGEKTYSYTSTVSQAMGWLMLTDSMGNLKWWHRYIADDPIKDTIGQCYLHDVLQMPDGGFAAVGSVGGSSTFTTIQQTWLLRVDSNGCYQTGCALPAGIKDNKKEELSGVTIYPNPANSELNIKLLDLNNPNYNLLITNTLGQTVHQTAINNQRSIVNISDFPQGIYFVTIKTGKATLTKKVVIEH
jgi:hypothetical protein